MRKACCGTCKWFSNTHQDTMGSNCWYGVLNVEEDSDVCLEYEIKISPDGGAEANLENKALADFANVKGKLVRVSQLCGYIEDNFWEGQASGGPFGVIVRILDTPKNELLRWRDDWLDPIYDVEVVVQGGLPEGLRSCWIHGKSYSIGGDEETGWIQHIL